MTANLTDSAEDEDKIPYDMSTFRDWAKHLKQEISQMKEQVSNAYATAQTASTHVNECTSRISELERKLDKNTTSAPLPDSNGFWRDNGGEIWAYDGDPDHPPRFIFSTVFQEVCETPADITANWADLEDYAPFTKISNPFTTGENHADR
jgi:hypothetical protein